VPTADVSVVDLTVALQKETLTKKSKKFLKRHQKEKLKGILGYTEEDVVSQDFIGDPRTSILMQVLELN